MRIVYGWHWGRRRFALLQLPFGPIFSEEFDRVLRSNCSVSATKIIRGAQVLASPADTLRMLRMQSHFRLVHVHRYLACDTSMVGAQDADSHDFCHGVLGLVHRERHAAFCVQEILDRFSIRK